VSVSVSVLDRALKVLHLEDDPDDRRVIHQWLHAQNIAVEFTAVDNQADFVRALDTLTFDIVLSDKSLPGFDGLSALHIVREKHPHIPFVFVTGSMGEEAAIETIKDGATDYVLKDRLSRLIPAVQRAIRESEQQERNRQIEESNRQQAALLDKAQDAILVTDVADKVLYWNKSAERIFGWSASATIGQKAMQYVALDPAKYKEARKIALEKGNWTGELLAANRGGNELTVEARWTLVRDEQGNPKSILMIDTDITQRKILETKFLRSQRLDSIGALAGGIAHDLNNALAPVIMGAELLKGNDDQVDRDKFLDVISTNANRATGLVRQILGFARGSGGQNVPVKLKDLIGEIARMIQDTFPKAIQFSLSLPEKGLWTVRGDTTELHQVLLNLCVNARDAMMPKGGKLALTGQNIMWDEAAAASAAASTAPGPYVLITVSDSGTGIPPEVLPRIFEPFFTTKKGDKGTGLGLSTVATIVKNHGGFIDIHTKAGSGTQFQVYLPAVPTAEIEEARPKEVVLPTGHGEWILVIDDEETVQELTKTTLESYGYHVVTAQNGLQGIARFRENREDIKLLITDRDMPHLDGAGVVRAIRELNPRIPVIIASGTKEGTEGIEETGALLKSLEKPYGLDQLLVAVADGLHP
jgi:two-component system, cell cycle sensor histidine kinase and response regulator CckA